MRLLRHKRQHDDVRPVILFTIAYLLIATVYALMRSNFEFLFYIAVVIVLGFLMLKVHRRVRFTPGVLWALSVWGLLHMMGGIVPVPEGFPINGTQRVLYSLWLIPNVLKYDHIIHAFGFGVATWASWQALSAGVKVKTPTIGLLILCVFAGMGFGALNEIIEFIAVLTIPDTNVGGYENTGWDLVSNFAGCVVAATGIWVRREK